MDEELKALLLTILKNQADILVQLERIKDEIVDDYDLKDNKSYQDSMKKLEDNLEKRKQLKFKTLIGEVSLLKMDLILKQNQ